MCIGARSVDILHTGIGPGQASCFLCPTNASCPPKSTSHSGGTSRTRIDGLWLVLAATENAASLLSQPHLSVGWLPESGSRPTVTLGRHIGELALRPEREAEVSPRTVEMDSPWSAVASALLVERAAMNAVRTELVLHVVRVDRRAAVRERPTRDSNPGPVE